MLRLRYYEDDQEVESDNELQELVNELSANGTGDFGGMGMVRHFTKAILSVIVEVYSVECFSSTQYTAISRKAVGKSAPDNPERYCGWF